MTTPLRVLLIQDRPEDVDLLLRELERGGYEPEALVIKTRHGLREALIRGKWDVVLSDAQLPRLDGLSALALVKESGKDIPFLLVCGQIGEEKAVAVLRAGAADYINKADLARLVPAVSREIREAAERRARRQAEDALRRREEQLRLALNAARMGTWDWDLEAGRIVWSERAEQILGVPTGRLPRTRSAYLGLIPPDDRPMVERALATAIDTDSEYQVAHRVVVPEGAVRWIGMKGRVYRDGGDLVRMSGTVADITDRKMAQAALVESEQRYRELYEQAPVALFTIRDDAIDRANGWAAELFGFSPDTLIGQPVSELFAPTPSGRERLDRLLPHVRTGASVLDEEVQLQRPDGMRWWGSLSMRPVPGLEDGALVVRATLVDVTVRKEAEEFLQLSQRAIDQSPDLILVCDRDYTYRRVNQAQARAHGLDAEEILGRTIADIIGESSFQQLKPQIDRCLAGEEVAFDTWFDYRGIGHRFMSVTYSPLRTAGNEIEGVIVVARDVSERKRSEDRRRDLERRLRQSAKMEALGTLAGGIAHDFNNLLLAILGYGELTRDALPEGSTLRANVEQIIAAGDRAQGLVKQILAFGRQSERELRPVLAQDVVHEATTFLRATLPATIDVQEHLDAEPCVIVADASQLNQVVLNLASNALHAMRDQGGVLEIGLEACTVSEEEAGNLGDLAPGPYVRLTVADTGHGMAPEVVERIYDPFFTTKSPGEGTGLGLSVVHGTVLSHGGFLSVDSTPGRGTRFTILFPRSDESVPTDDHDPGQIAGSERVLFVDDEPQIVRLGHEMLGRLGYRVTTVSDPVRALELFRDTPEEWDLLVTDQTMPRQTGLELARACRALRPRLPVILTTGYSESVTPDKVLHEGIQVLIMKPYGGQELGRAVRTALDGARTSLERAGPSRS